MGMQGEISALIQLMEDPDEEIFAHVKQELSRMGDGLIPQLEQYWELNELGPLFQQRVVTLIQELQYHAIYKRLREWKESDDKDLLEAMLILNRLSNPTESEAQLKQQVMKIRQDIWLELNDFLTAFEAINVFNTILFKVHQFQGVGVSVNGHNTLGELMATKRGEPLVLGALYSWLAEALEIQLPAINVPGDCILAYQELDYQGGVETLFYVNPHQGGQIVSREEIEGMLVAMQYPYDDRFFNTAGRLEWVGRMINSLINQSIANRDDKKVSELRALQALMLE
jgi:regulator of sirC expression with transglutaminase-like and TPR domain